MALYLPGTQPVQLTFVPVQPALHTQDAMFALRATEFEYRGHERHCDLSSSEYKPATQSPHVFVNELTKAEYCPTAQSVHFADPIVSLYLPATQPVH